MATANLCTLISRGRAVVAPQVPVPSRDPAGAGAQQPPAGTAVMSGTLVAMDTGRPVRRARVTLTNTDRADARSATSDDQGRFSFTALVGGRYTLTANKPGYLDALCAVGLADTMDANVCFVASPSVMPTVEKVCAIKLSKTAPCSRIST